MARQIDHLTPEEREHVDVYRYAGYGIATLSTGHVLLEIKSHEDWSSGDEPNYVTGFLMSREECRDPGEALLRLAQALHPPVPKPNGDG